MRKVYQTIEQAAPTSASVLIWGESGTGKELVAQTIHQLSPRNQLPFVPINCAAIPETLLESEIFGHEKGAFTGAFDRREGCFELADRGTLFLDEIAEMTPATQVKLLRVLQERKFRRLGGRQEQAVDVRVIAATNAVPADAVKSGKLREDLYYRLNVFAIELPPLRKRKEDLPLLVQAFLAEFNGRNRKAVSALDPAAMRALEQYNWPGNVRELRNVIERAVILCSGQFIEPKHLPPLVAGAHGGNRQADAVAHARYHGGGGRESADPDDARAHARQQDARRRDSRHQPQDAAQQVEQAARARHQAGRSRFEPLSSVADASWNPRETDRRRHGHRRAVGRAVERAQRPPWCRAW